jgi:glycosyltransferase involved in cell wall biosynthesis
MQDVRAYGLANPVAVIPNGIDCGVYATVDRPTAQAEAARLWPELVDKRVLLFMSRVHPHKGLMNLVEAWGRLHRQHGDWRLVIAGPDEVNHQRSLLAAATQNGSRDSITFTGAVYGQARLALFAACDLFVLPSLSENFGMVVAEALASGRPAITTVGAPWEELQTHRCGWRIPLGLEPLTEQLAAALSLSDAELTDMGQRGRQLIRSHRYSLESVVGETLAVYRWMLGRGERPACVQIIPGD